MRNSVTTARTLALIPSSSNPNKSYEIRLGGDGVVYCTCPAWKLHGNKWCKHLEFYHSGITPSGSSVVDKNAKEALLDFYQKESQKQITSHKITPDGKCAMCNSSAEAINEFGFECNPSAMDNVIDSILTGRWQDPRIKEK